MKFLRFFLLFIPFVSAVVINCEFRKSFTYSAIGSVYECSLNSNPSITLPNTVIISANGDHYNSSMNHEKVDSFRSDSKTIHYIPHELNEIFSNLIAIIIYYGRIKEIHQKDFEKYSKLKVLSLDDNDITYLEKDLFKFNTQLQIISLSRNKINQIYPTIFDHLNQLERLWLNRNQCVNKYKNGKSEILELIKEVKENCLPDIFLAFKQIKEVNETINVSFDTIKNQLNEKSSNLESKMENLINKQDEKLQKSESNLNQKVESIANKITNEIQTLMKQQEKNSMSKFDEQFAAVSLNLKKLKNQFESEIFKISNIMSKLNQITRAQSDEQHDELKSEIIKNFKDNEAKMNKNMKILEMKMSQELNFLKQNMNQEMENLLNTSSQQVQKLNSTSNIQYLHMNKQEHEDIRTKFNEQHDEIQKNLINLKNETSQKLFYHEKNMLNLFLFIGVPFICLFTSSNIAMIYLCCRKYTKISKRQKPSPLNDIEFEERNL